MGAPKKISIAQWAVNLTHPVTSMEDWCQQVEKVMKTCAQRGDDILTLPEYVSEMWMPWCPLPVKITRELAWISDQAWEAIPRLQEIVNETGVALQAGTMPWRDIRQQGRFVNRAWMLFPDRKPVYHDKLAMTPFEQDRRSWKLDPGRTFRVFKWRGLKMAMLICLDIELPAMAAKIAALDIDLMLVPSMTYKQAGYYRVFNCARARAVELMTCVAVTGCIGGAARPGHDYQRTTCQGGAAVYLPSEEEFGHTGILNAMPVHGTHNGKGKILRTPDIPLDEIRRLRRGGAEVWPGAWRANKVRIKTGQ